VYNLFNKLLQTYGKTTIIDFWSEILPFLFCLNLNESENDTFENKKNIADALPIAFSELDFVFLHRFQACDLIGIKYNNNNNNNNSSNEKNLKIIAAVSTTTTTIVESTAVLFEELESTLLFVLNGNKNVFNLTHIGLDNASIRNRLKFAKKLELRVATCVVTIYKLMAFLNNKNNYFDGGDNHSSNNNFSFFEELSLWKIVRLVLTVSDILKIDWHDANFVNDENKV
jgi:hypothetical protein